MHQVELTEEGQLHTDAILRIVFAQVVRIVRLSEAEWQTIYDELAAISDMNFRFKSNEQHMSYATALANNLHVSWGGGLQRNVKTIYVFYVFLMFLILVPLLYLSISCTATLMCFRVLG